MADAAAAHAAVARLGDNVDFYKVGLQLFTAAGPEFVRGLKGEGKKVFLDLKLHDIPNTVAGAVTSIASLGVDMLTVHASGGGEMLAAAVKAATSAVRPPVILAVTVLTSLDDTQLAAIGVSGSTGAQVERLARLAQGSGCGGVVCSPQEAAAMRRVLNPSMLIVTPGVRPAGTEHGDQSRVASPAAALRAGATHLVIGRPILAAADPQAATRAILDEMGTVQ